MLVRVQLLDESDAADRVERVQDAARHEHRNAAAFVAVIQRIHGISQCVCSELARGRDQVIDIERGRPRVHVDLTCFGELGDVLGRARERVDICAAEERRTRNDARRRLLDDLPAVTQVEEEQRVERTRNGHALGRIRRQHAIIALKNHRDRRIRHEKTFVRVKKTISKQDF